jgi:Na+-transporting NADH:ubiquinone oxidoreductase subunit NqrD
VKKLIQTKEHGQKKKMIDSYLILELMVKVVGDLFLKLLVYSVAVKVVVSVGLIISDQTLNVVTLQKKKMNSSSNSIVFLVTSKFH